jgi:hypothetical protein
MPRRLIDNDDTFKSHFTPDQITTLRKVIAKHSKRKNTFDALVLSYPKASAKDRKAIEKILGDNALEISLQDDTTTIHERFNIQEDEDVTPPPQPPPNNNALIPYQGQSNNNPLPQPENRENTQSLISSLISGILHHPWITGVSSGTAILLFILKCASDILETQMKIQALEKGLDNAEKRLLVVAEKATPAIIDAIERANTTFHDAKETVTETTVSIVSFGLWTSTAIVAGYCAYKVAQLAHAYLETFLIHKRGMADIEAKHKTSQLQLENEMMRRELDGREKEVIMTNSLRKKELEESRRMIHQLKTELKDNPEGQQILQRQTEILHDYVPEAIGDPRSEAQPPQATAEPQPQQPSAQQPKQPRSRSVSMVSVHGDLYTRRSYERMQQSDDAKAREARIQAMREKYLQ